MQLQWHLARAAIGHITDDRATQHRAMHPDLVGAPGARPEFEPGAAVMGAKYAVIGDRGLAGGVEHHMSAHPPGLLLAGGLDAALRLRRRAGDDRPIDLLDFSLGE